MKHLVEFPLEDGGTITVEVDEPDAGGHLTRGLNPLESTDKASRTFEAALEKIKPAAAVIIAKLRDISNPPRQLEVEFGLKMSAGAGVFIASAVTEANFKVTLTWKSEEQKG